MSEREWVDTKDSNCGLTHLHSVCVWTDCGTVGLWDCGTVSGTVSECE